ncbi:hypothetical protein ABZ858_27570 [Streptomyces sp. NPDC047017]|uniref:hypothetical protein n=1 Tax=Streptomyces sp. NPDC047017 TaxID=3155024 RepID=UPI0033DA478B
MDVLLCAARGRRLTEPVRLLDEMPEFPFPSPFPGWDGSPGPDGVPRGTRVRHGAGGHDTRPLPDAVRPPARAGR